MSSNADLNAAFASTAGHLMAGKYFQIAAFVMLIYDHMLTFSDEVERIWKQKLTGATILFLLNRYLSPLEFVVILDAFNDPIWSKHPARCSRFVIFEGLGTMLLVGICELIMIIRIYALYKRSTIILAFLMSLWVAQITLTVVGLTKGFPVPRSPTLTGCILTGSDSLFPAIWVAPLVTDTCIFALTLWRTRSLTISRRVPTIQIFVRDGALYYCLIFMSNFINTIIYFLAPDDLKAIGASFSQLITSVMVSRLVLNLRSVSIPESRTYSMDTGETVLLDTFAARTIGNLGEEFDLGDNLGDHDAYFEAFERQRSMELRRLAPSRLDKLVHVV